MGALTDGMGGTSDQLGATIDATELDSDAVTTAKIADSAVTADELADSAVTELGLGDDAVKARHLDDGTIGIAAMADTVLTSAKLLDSTLQSIKYDDSSVINCKLDDSVVDGLKLADDAVLFRHLAKPYEAKRLVVTTDSAAAVDSVFTFTAAFAAAPAVTWGVDNSDTSVVTHAQVTMTLVGVDSVSFEVAAQTGQEDDTVGVMVLATEI